jgi:hypothetical protein
MKVRMYCQGLGDCFLLSFPGGGRNIYILVDCGVFMGTPGAKEMMVQIAQDIQQTTQGHLDAVVVTHEHWDHLSGFNQAKQIFDNMTIGEVWFAWTEKPDDEFALSLRKDREERANKLRLAVEQWQNAGLHPETSERVSSILDFFGAPAGVSNQLTTREALNYLSARDDASKRYLEPGETFNLKGVENVRVFVLGPPRDEKLLRKSDPTKRGRETYDEPLASSLERSFFAAVSRARGIDDPIEDVLSDPFDKYFRIPIAEAQKQDFFIKRYGFYTDDTVDTGEWRRIDNDWLVVAGDLALNLDSDTNNTSLVLAFELEEEGKVMLFAADAQVGNWLSWKSLNWTIKGAKGERNINIDDLLARTVLYKVGHHGSHNATLRDEGLEKMKSKDLMTMIPVDQVMAQKKKFLMPFPALLNRLEEKCSGRIMRIDQGLADAQTLKLKGLDTNQRNSFLKAVKKETLFIEVDLNAL